MKNCVRLFSLVLALCFVSNAGRAQLTHQPSVVWNRVAAKPIEYSAPRFPTFGAPRVLAVDSSLKTRILAGLRAVYETANPEGRHGVAGSIIAPKLGQISFAIGDNFAGDAMNDTLAFEIGSNTKTFITALILKLQEQGKLSIKDSLWKWLPSYPNIDSTITIKQLLEHSSGIYDYLNDDPTAAVLNSAYAGDPEHTWTPEEILDSYVDVPNFAPGKSYRYSNTNFILLGMIAAKATGMTAAAALHQYFLEPLYLQHVVPAWEDSVTDAVAHQWFPGAHYPSVDFYEIPKRAQLTAAHTAGGIIATVTDLARWSDALYTGQLLSTTSMHQMKTWHSWPDGTVYGLGAMLIPYYSHNFVGHGGHLIGFSSDMATNPKDSVTFVLYTNYDVLSGDKSLNDYAIAVLDAVYAPSAGIGSQASGVPTVSVWPNPATSGIAFESPKSGEIVYTLFDDLGRSVGTATTTEARTPAVMNVASLPSGTYHYRATGADFEASGSVLVQH